LFLAAVAATMVGGLLIGTCRRILAVVLVMMGVDVERTWLDEGLGILAGGLILLHFGAGLAAIALFALSDLIPAAIRTVSSRWQRPWSKHPQNGDDSGGRIHCNLPSKVVSSPRCI
jgi:hypothetical protein